MHLTKTLPNNIKEIVWNEDTVVRRQGGYDIDKTTLGTNFQEWLPKGAVMAFDASTGKVKVVKTAQVHANASSGATSFKIKKGHGLAVGDAIGGNTITALDTTNDDYDEVTCSATSKALKAGDILAEATASDVIGFNYATVKIDKFPTCTVTVQAYEIEEDTAPTLLNADIKAALTSRHAFKAI